MERGCDYSWGLGVEGDLMRCGTVKNGVDMISEIYQRVLCGTHDSDAAHYSSSAGRHQNTRCLRSSASRLDLQV